MQRLNYNKYKNACRKILCILIFEYIVCVCVCTRFQMLVLLSMDFFFFRSLAHSLSLYPSLFASIYKEIKGMRRLLF